MNAEFRPGDLVMQAPEPSGGLILRARYGIGLVLMVVQRKAGTNPEQVFVMWSGPRANSRLSWVYAFGLEKA